MCYLYRRTRHNKALYVRDAQRRPHCSSVMVYSHGVPAVSHLFVEVACFKDETREEQIIYFSLARFSYLFTVGLLR